MKKFTAFSLVTLLIMVMFACSGAKTPSATAEKMAGYLQSKDYVAFVECLAIDDSTKTAEENAKNKEMIIALMKDKGDKQMAEKGGIKSYEVLEEVIAEDGLTATVKMKYTYGNGTAEEQTTNLVKVDNEWKGSMDK